MGKIYWSKALTTATILIVLHQFAVASQWPYLQVYPPINETDGRTPLYFALVLSFGGDYKSIGVLPGVQIALDYINSQPSILPGYSLHYTLTDSQCERSEAIESFFRQILPGPTKVGWIGSGCSVATEPTAEVTPFYNISQLSCISASPRLANRKIFRYHFQLLANAVILAKGFLGIILEFGWKRVSIITQNENLHTTMMDSLKRGLIENEVDFTETLFTSADSISGLGEEPYESGARVFIWATYSSHANALACEAHKRGLRYPKYQFLIFGWYSEGWLLKPATDGKFNCTLQEKARTLDYALSVKMLDSHTNPSLITEGGLTFLEFEKQYWAKVNSSFYSDMVNRFLIYSEQCHEATLSLAYALHNTVQDLQSDQGLNLEAAQQAGLPDGETFSLANFSYSNSVIVERMFHHLNNTDFLGITGNKVTFDKNGVRLIESLLIDQYRPADTVNIVGVGTVAVSTLSVILLRENQLWPDGTPTDGVPIVNIVTVALPISVLYTILAFGGIVFAVACMIFNYIHREKKLIRLSSPRLNYLIGIGAVLLYINVIFFATRINDATTSLVLCHFNPFLTHIGYALSYGTIFCKMFRIWYIFNNPTLRKKFTIKDKYLGFTVLGLVVFDIITLAVYMLVEGPRGQLKVSLFHSGEHEEEHVGPTGEVHHFYLYQCTSRGRTIWLTFLSIQKCFLNVIVLFLAFRTRKVKMKGLDDSRFIIASVYVTSCILPITIIAMFTLGQFVTLYAAVIGGGFHIAVTSILILVFVPKMVALYKDPSGEKIGGKGICSTPAIPSVLEHSEYRNEMETLYQQIRELEAHLKEKSGNSAAAVRPDTDNDAATTDTTPQTPSFHPNDDAGTDTQSPSTTLVEANQLVANTV